MLKHIVSFKFKDGVTDKKIDELASRLGALPDKIAEIKGYQFGKDMVRSERSFDFALVSDFENLEAMKRYQVHPEHQKVIELVKELCSDIVAVDYLY